VKNRLSRLAQIREDLNFSVILLGLGFAIAAFSFVPQADQFVRSGSAAVRADITK
jgi:hypothetical protein